MQTEPKNTDVLALAYLGDAIYELAVRERIMSIGSISRADSLHTLQLEDELPEFVFSQPVSISTDFFVTISGIPNYEMNPKTHAINSVYMASVLRPEGERNTTYVYCDSLAFVNNQAYFTNNFRWIENTSAPVSFAMAPCLTLADGQPVSVAAIISSGNDADTRYYRTDGRQLTAAPRQGIYLVRRPDGSTTKRIAK